MPITSSAAKHMKTDAARRLRNRAARAAVLTSKNQLQSLVENADQAKAEAEFRRLCSLLDKGVKRGIITRNTADRNKSRAARRLAALKKA